MESLVIQEQNKNSSVFYTEDSSSESNTSELSRHRDEEAYYSRKHNTPRSRTPEPRKHNRTSEFTTSPQLSPHLHKPVTHAQSVPTLEVQDRVRRTPSRVHEKSPSRVSYEGSSTVEYQVRYVGGYRSGPEDESEEPIRLLPYDKSPTRPRRGSEPLDIVEARRNESCNQPSSSVSEHNIASTQYSHKSRDERVDVPLSFSRSPTSSPYLRRKASDIQSSANYTPTAGSTPLPAQKQKKTAIVSPLLDMSDSRPRSVPPGLMMFDPTDPESERVEQVSAIG